MMTRSFILTIILGFLIPNSIDAQVAKGDRVLAWQVDVTENGDYELAFEFAENACIESVHFSINWSSLEPDADYFDTDFISNSLDIANYYYPLKGVQLELQIAVTNTTAKEVPSDLLDVPFSDPILINRFKIAIDTIFNHIPDIEIAALNIGNESDILFGTNAADYESYKTFLDSIVPYAKSRYFDLYAKEIKIGTTLTLDGLISPSKSTLCQILNADLDIISTTYYPLALDFTMKSPSVVEEDFDALIAIYSSPEQPVYFAECGYASSTTCNSSEELQASFYSAVFSSWDEHYDHIKYLTIFKSTDWSVGEVEDFGTYYGIDDPIFLEYLRTLGVRTWEGDGTNKLAYEFIICELNARDWCSTTCNLTSIESDQMTFELFPNPAQESITIASEMTIFQSKIYTLTGEQVLMTNTSSLDISSLETGFYLLEIRTDSGNIYRQKFLKR